MREGYKESEIGMIPESWDYLRLDRVFSIARGGSPRPISEYLTESSDGYNWIKIGDTQNVEKYIYSTKQRIKKEGLKKSLLVKEDDFILSNSMSFGKPYIMKTEGCIHDGWLLLRRIEDTLSIDYSYYLLSSSFIKSQFKSKAAGSTVQNLNIKLVASVMAPLPSFSEQQKIAEILSTLDDKIGLIDEQISETSELKKGLMQRLLSKGIGHSQFKDSPLGEIPESWEVVKMGKVVMVKVGRDLQEDQYSENKSEKYKFPVYSNTVANNGLYGFYDFVEYEGNSVTVVGRGIGVGTAFARKGTFSAIGRLLVLFPCETLNNVFLSFYINFSIKFFAENSAIPQLTGAQIVKYDMKIPPLPEQQKIADILSTVDEKLDVLSEKKGHYQELKKGLMQQLLTGKIRVSGLIEKN
jgi:type I restriction enzyme S subunit